MTKLKLVYTFYSALFFTSVLTANTLDSTIVHSDSTLSESVTFSDFTDTTGGLFLEMVAIPGGSFLMGSNLEEEEQPVHKVQLDSFYIGKFEVTQAQWMIIMKNNISKTWGDNLPVEQVTWKKVQVFIEELNRLTGKKYRLPTEAEWEYAARAGTTTIFNTGDCLSADEANYNGTSPYKGCPDGIYRRKQLPVGSFEPNAWGLYDMHGNVWEWCSDFYSDDYYKESPDSNPQGPDSGNYKVIRGGGWGYFADGCRSANRGFYGASLSYDDIGFRLVCEYSTEE